MSVNRFFNNMDEMLAYVEKVKEEVPANVYESILFLCGLLENQGDSRKVILNGKDIRVDISIADYIVALNKMGIETLACCSGVQEEHPDGVFKPKQGYLSVKWSNDLMHWVAAKCDWNKIEYERLDVYFEDAISFYLKTTDKAELQERWLYLYNLLRDYIIQRESEEN